MGSSEEDSVKRHRQPGQPCASNDLYLGRVLPLISEWLLCSPEVVGI